jgi:ferredoxin--NADP+ reductase
VLDPETQRPLVGQYTAGWIKRGPSGVIGTNKPDAVETVECMLEDLANGSHLDPPQPGPDAVEQLVRARQPHVFTYADWQRLNEQETAAGKATNRPRVKFTSVEEMEKALGRT